MIFTHNAKICCLLFRPKYNGHCTANGHSYSCRNLIVFYGQKAHSDIAWGKELKPGWMTVFLSLNSTILASSKIHITTCKKKKYLHRYSERIQYEIFLLLFSRVVQWTNYSALRPQLEGGDVMGDSDNELCTIFIHVWHFAKVHWWKPVTHNMCAHFNVEI